MVSYHWYARSAHRRGERCTGGDEGRAPRLCDRLSLEEFLYDFFLERFGTAFAAEVHLSAFYTSVRRVAQENRKIGTFARLLGINDALPVVRATTCCYRTPIISGTFL